MHEKYKEEKEDEKRFIVKNYLLMKDTIAVLRSLIVTTCKSNGSLIDQQCNENDKEDEYDAVEDDYEQEVNEQKQIWNQSDDIMDKKQDCEDSPFQDLDEYD
ncbi:MAG: hypothetical protein EZS28_043601 [Streblomastix strix]|uniref:Uncharacterized protein n=1 Tax=Streblomastix strix TaxID=222440 RepID=A0A5J4TSH3_9EUKA|nr:MAG: hypothetical protein EZS28_043601 [Streblomastix strix]